MLQKELNEENKEIKGKAYELYEKHGFKDGNHFVDWLEAEKQAGKIRDKQQTAKPPKSNQNKQQTVKPSKSNQNKQSNNMLIAIIAIMCVIVVILLLMLFNKGSMMNLSGKSLSDSKIMVLVLDPKDNEKLVVFGDTHFEFGESSLSVEAKTLLDKDVQVLRENPLTNVRMAGYTSARGSEEVNQELSEVRASSVRDYLIENGIAPERITTIGYGRTRPALYEVTPGDINSKEAMANMRVLFEVVVK